MQKLRMLPILVVVLAVGLFLSFLPVREAMAQRPANDDQIYEAAVNRAKASQAKHQKSILKQPGVHGAGVGLMEDGKRVGIHVFVSRGEKRPELPAELDGVPVRFIESGRFVAHNGPCDLTDCHAETLPRPVQMGNSTGNANAIFAGTLGFRVVRKDDPTVVGYITANHIAALFGDNFCPAQINPENLTPFGTDQCQPGLFDAAGNACITKIGDLTQVVPLVMGEDYLNIIDAAFVESNRSCVSKMIRDIGAPTSSPAVPKLGSLVKLSGRTSGLRTVRVLSINAFGPIGYGSECGSAFFVNQIVTIPVPGLLASGLCASRPGDSGAPVVTSKRQPVGINFAGSEDCTVGIVEPITPILAALGVKIDTAADAPAAGSCP